MSLTTLHQSTQDIELVNRIVAAAFQEAHANEALGDTPYGQTLLNGGSSITVTDVFLWPICIDNRDAYAYAVESGNEHPGSDVGVVSDASISTAIQTYWPVPPGQVP
jgi:hypothetical protein